MYYSQPLSSSPPLAASHYHQNQSLIEVTGEGSLSISPNRALITLGAITENKTLGTAQKENTNSITNIINSLLKLNIPKEHIQTVEYRIDMQYLYEDNKQIFKGYQVTHHLQVTLDRVELTGMVVDTAVTHGANSITNIQFTTTHPEIYYNQALELALKNAERKALTITNTLNTTLIRYPNQIQEQSRTQEAVPFQSALFAGSTTTPIQPGQLIITATLKVQYAYMY